MDKVIINLAVEDHDGKDGEIIELGKVSKDTQGSIWGGYDGGAGLNPGRAG